MPYKHSNGTTQDILLSYFHIYDTNNQNEVEYVTRIEKINFQQNMMQYHKT
jgi:hypothetical protein